MSVVKLLFGPQCFNGSFADEHFSFLVYKVGEWNQPPHA